MLVAILRDNLFIVTRDVHTVKRCLIQIALRAHRSTMRLVPERHGINQKSSYCVRKRSIELYSATSIRVILRCFTELSFVLLKMGPSRARFKATPHPNVSFSLFRLCFLCHPHTTYSFTQSSSSISIDLKRTAQRRN